MTHFSGDAWRNRTTPLISSPWPTPHDEPIIATAAAPWYPSPLTTARRPVSSIADCKVSTLAVVSRVTVPSLKLISIFEIFGKDSNFFLTVSTQDSQVNCTANSTWKKTDFVNNKVYYSLIVCFSVKIIQSQDQGSYLLHVFDLMSEVPLWKSNPSSLLASQSVDSSLETKSLRHVCTALGNFTHCKIILATVSNIQFKAIFKNVAFYNKRKNLQAKFSIVVLVLW